MNLENIRTNIIRIAQEKLQRHNSMGIESRLSIFEVAELKDIVSGNKVELKTNRAYFFGLHSLN